MRVKLLEVRDSATFIPCIGIEMSSPETEQEHYLLRRAGYSLQPASCGGCVLFGRLDGKEFHYDCYNWPAGARTMRVAHRYVAEHWDELESGDVICDEHILGDRDTPKLSERLTAPL